MRASFAAVICALQKAKPVVSMTIVTLAVCAQALFAVAATAAHQEMFGMAPRASAAALRMIARLMVTARQEIHIVLAKVPPLLIVVVMETAMSAVIMLIAEQARYAPAGLVLAVLFAVTAKLRVLSSVMVAFVAKTIALSIVLQ